MGDVLDRTTLTGRELCALKTLLEAELSGTEPAAFRLSYAPGPLSGASFGPAQWDLRQNRDNSQARFQELLETSGLFSAAEIQWVMDTVKTSQGAPGVLEDPYSLGPFTERINQALSSLAAMDQIVAWADSAVRSRLETVDRVIASMPDGDRKDELLNSVAAQLALADYDNWLTLNETGEKAYMAKYLRDGSVTLPSGESVTWDPSLDALTNIIAFDVRTKAFRTDTKGTLGRIVRLAKGLRECGLLGAGDPSGVVAGQLGAVATDAVESIRASVANAESTGPPCPIVLDLDGDGVETLGVQQGTFFDHDGDGFAERTGWAAPEDGLLVWDRNANGRIDSGGELFGDRTRLGDGTLAANGYQALSELDGNADGAIDASDAAFAQLRVWQDADADGLAAPDELRTLGELGIESVGVAYTESGMVDPQGNDHRVVSTFRRTDGTTGATADVWFQADRLYSTATAYVEVPPEVAALPDAAGYGTVYDLRQAMARDGSGALRGLVEAFVGESDAAARRGTVEQVLFAWTGAAGVDPGSRGPYIDARKVVALEQFLGEPFVGVGGASDPNVNAVGPLEQAYADLVEFVYGQLMAQSHLRSLYGLVTYAWDAAAQDLRADLSGVLAEIESRIAADPAQGRQDLSEFSRTVRGLRDEQVMGYWAFRESMAAQSEEYRWVMDAGGKGVITGTTGADALRGGDGDDSLTGDRGKDALYGEAGDDTLLGGEQEDVLVGGAGNDWLFGGSEGDRLEGGAGADRLYGDGENDTLLGGADADTLDGGAGNDVLDGGPGNDWLDGSFGDDIYLFGRGSGQDTVNDGDWQVVDTDRILVAGNRPVTPPRDGGG